MMTVGCVKWQSMVGKVSAVLLQKMLKGWY